MASADVKINVKFRDELGRFGAELSEAATAAVLEAVEKAAEMAREDAPRRPGPADPRYGRLADQIEGRAFGNQGTVISKAGHSLFVHDGNRRHFQTGKVTFWWENAPGGARKWIPGENLIDHPGHPAPQPFMLRALGYLKQRLPEIYKKHARV